MNSPRHSPITLIAFLAAGSFLSGDVSRAATFFQTTDSTTDSISWMTAIWGTPGATPTAGNSYISDGSTVATLRSGSAASGVTFPGDSLTLRNGVNFIVKRNARANYILESGAKMSAGATRSIQGTVQVASGQTTTWDSISNTFTFDAPISGSGSISIAGTSGSVVVTSAANDFTGNWTVNSGTLTFQDNALTKFVIGANGVNNSISGGGALNLSGDFSFDLSSAVAVNGNSWQLVNVGSLNETFTATFAIQGFTEAANTWTNGSGYSFSEATGMLSYSAVPEPSTYAMLFAGMGLCFYRRRVERKPTV